MKEEWEGGLTQKVVNSILGEVHLYRHGGSESTLLMSTQSPATTADAWSVQQTHAVLRT